MNLQKFLNYALIFLLTFLVVQLFFRQTAPAPMANESLAITSSATFTTGKAVTLTLTNNTKTPLALSSDCPAEPFTVSRYVDGVWQPQTATTTAGRCTTDALTLAPGERTIVSYQPWQATLFREVGRYRVAIPTTIDGKAKTFEHELAIETPGIFGIAWREVFYRPIYNALIFLTDIAGHSFGWGIVLLTLLVRVILFFPFHRSMVSQRKMQAIQPEIDAIKKKYADNQQMLAMETMALFKKHNVSPFSSCLPILIQLPFLFALFWIVQGGLGENNFVLLYAPLADFNLVAVSTHFFGLNLAVPDALYIVPVIVALLQFIQMKLAFASSKKHQPKPDGENPMADAMALTTKWMPYFLPVVVGVGALSMPAAVGLYWGASTLFSIGQQLLVNRLVK